ncbi:peroxide stress protein YaaA [Pigmentiphaga aceris]|uniref:UPF0246 protein FXN63_17675 n=1 Tax=Pigmentiphaga aceris TaxID=1940612 RepID=A0A5C0B0Q7_9BURK|nr:peroxide stress protein YaaA [Pigmentiphaga aceris]QEI07464.1 peroxide stress protein YaaA [Pigmentiphaga aceris]
MLLLLSPAKKLDYDTPAHIAKHTQPLFVDQAAALIKVLKKKTPADIAELMDLSEALSELNATRYADWKPEFSADTAKPAVLAFNGDVYEGLDAPSLTSAQLDWAQDHMVILSGLYGALRPLDLMRPYRLEMGTRLATDQGKTLYAFWNRTIADYLNQRLSDAGGGRVILNLASEEYFKSVDRKVLDARVVQCVFEDWKTDKYKVISFHAKRARGLMARYVVTHKARGTAALKNFDAEGYAFDADVSEEDRLVFRRRQA